MPLCNGPSWHKATNRTVGRPGIVPAVLCPDDTDAGHFTFVWFAASHLPDGRALALREAGDREVIVLGDTAIQVQAPEPLRAQILQTAHRITTDSSGCPIRHPIGDDPARRPPAPVAVEDLSGVVAVSACKYALNEPSQAGEDAPGLLSSVLLTEGDAADAVRGVGLAPIGGGPDSPETCSEGYGDDIIVLGVEADDGLHEIYLRYSGCDHNGFDDGVAVRTLTPTSVAPFITGPNTVFSGGGPDFVVGLTGSHS